MISAMRRCLLLLTHKVGVSKNGSSSSSAVAAAARFWLALLLNRCGSTFPNLSHDERESRDGRLTNDKSRFHSLNTVTGDFECDGPDHGANELDCQPLLRRAGMGKMTKKTLLISAILSAALFSVLTVAQEPVQDIDKKAHPYPAAAQSHVVEANKAISMAQKDNNAANAAASKKKEIDLQPDVRGRAANQDTNQTLHARNGSAQ